MFFSSFAFFRCRICVRIHYHDKKLAFKAENPNKGRRWVHLVANHHSGVKEKPENSDLRRRPIEFPLPDSEAHLKERYDMTCCWCFRSFKSTKELREHQQAEHKEMMRHQMFDLARLEQPRERPLPHPVALPPQPKLYRRSPVVDETSANRDGNMPLDSPGGVTLRSVPPDGSAPQTNAGCTDRVMQPEEDASSRDIPLGDTSMLLQPDTRPITAEQLVNEVKGIYSGLVIDEKKCVENIAQRASTGEKLSNDEWQALIALHRTLLYEHHDFLVCDRTLIQPYAVHSSNILQLASQHPTASPALRGLAKKCAMPARLWENGIHAFLELLRQQLPDSYDHMLAFVYIAYNMMTLFMESIPRFLETWIERLGDLARYRMAIEEINMRDRKIWSNAARMWYNKAADLSPSVGRFQHHLAVLAQPMIVQQLFYYSKSLVSVIPFEKARESIMLLFSPFLDEEKGADTFQKYATIESSLVAAFGILFTRGRVQDYTRSASQYTEHLGTSITRMGVQWKSQGPEVASSLIVGLLDFGNENSCLWKGFNDNVAAVKSRRSDREETDSLKLEREDAKTQELLREEFWRSVTGNSYEIANRPMLHHGTGSEDKFESSDEVMAHVLHLFYETVAIVAQRSGDQNTVPFMNIILSFLWDLAYIPGGLMCLECYVPWEWIIVFLNTIERSRICDERVESERFPQQIYEPDRHLPEDFCMRGVRWATHVFPPGYFTRSVPDEDERMLEPPHFESQRVERCVWLGMRLASVSPLT